MHRRARPLSNPPQGAVFQVMELKMLKQFLYGAAALVIVGGVAYAENNAASPPPPPLDAQVADNADGPPPPPGDGQGWWGRKGHHGGGRHMHRGMGGPEMMAGPGDPSPMGEPGIMSRQGFHLELGNGIGVHVECGKIEMKDCIANAQPLIDAAKATAAAQPQTKVQ